MNMGSESVYTGMKKRMEKLNKDIEEKKKLFGLFASGKILKSDAEKAAQNSNIDEDSDDLDSSDEEDKLDKEIEEEMKNALKKDQFGEKQQRLDDTLKEKGIKVTRERLSSQNSSRQSNM